MSHLELNASIELPGDESIGHGHHHAGNGEQHKQQQYAPIRKRGGKKTFYIFALSLQTSERSQALQD